MNKHHSIVKLIQVHIFFHPRFLSPTPFLADNLSSSPCCPISSCSPGNESFFVPCLLLWKQISHLSLPLPSSLSVSVLSFPPLLLTLFSPNAPSVDPSSYSSLNTSFSSPPLLSQLPFPTPSVLCSLLPFLFKYTPHPFLHPSPFLCPLLPLSFLSAPLH